uniref:Uncharacterized protein n=1 Tax=Meloidogyne incognita TaxID=6306 RepID=A0A914LUX4_MELIC
MSFKNTVNVDVGLADLYKTLAKMNMRLPTRRPDTMSGKYWDDLNQLYTAGIIT